MPSTIAPSSSSLAAQCWATLLRGAGRRGGEIRYPDPKSSTCPAPTGTHTKHKHPPRSPAARHEAAQARQAAGRIRQHLFGKEDGTVTSRLGAQPRAAPLDAAIGQLGSRLDSLGGNCVAVPLVSSTAKQAAGATAVACSRSHSPLAGERALAQALEPSVLPIEPANLAGTCANEWEKSPTKQGK